MKQLLFFPLILMVLLSTISCDPKTVFDNFIGIEKAGWNKDSVKIFSVVVNDTLINHNIYLNLRNRTTYPFSNIWLFIGIQSPDGEILKDTVQYALADTSGKWLGEGFSGIKDNRFLYRGNVYFPRRGTYVFSVRHGMRQELLTGISDIGFRVEKK